MNMLYIALMVIAGCLIAMQSPINAALARNVGPLEASLISFSTGTICLLAAVLLFGKGHITRAFGAPLWQWSGGLLGAVLVFAALVSVPRIGALSTGVAMIIGNLLMAAILDNYGAFGLPVLPVSFARLAGLALMAGGLALVFKS